MRILLFRANSPTRLSRIPKKPEKIPFVMEPLDRAAMTVMAKRMIKNFSTAENLIAHLARGGVRNARTRSEIMPPKKEDVTPIFSALSPSPRRAMG